MKKLIIICALIVSNASIGQNNLSTNSVLSKANFNYGYLVDYSNSSTNNWSSTFSFYLTNHQFEFGNRTGIARLFENSIGLYNCGYVGYNLIEPISVSLPIDTSPLELILNFSVLSVVIVKVLVEGNPNFETSPGGAECEI